MRRLAGLIGGMALCGSAALAGSSTLSETPAIRLLREPSPAVRNMMPPGYSVVPAVGELPMTLGQTPLRDITEAFSLGTVHHIKNGGQEFAWVCYLAPHASEPKLTVMWFVSTEKKGRDWIMTGVAFETDLTAMPEGCSAFSSPGSVDLGFEEPNLGSSQAEVDKAMSVGKPIRVEPDGTSTWLHAPDAMFPEHTGGRSTELRFKVSHDKVVAFAVRLVDR